MGSIMKARCRLLLIGLFHVVAPTPLVVAAVVDYLTPVVTPANSYRVHADVTEQKVHADMTEQEAENESYWASAYSRIELHMPPEQVEAAIGCPPGYYEGEHPRPPSMSPLVRIPPLRQSGVDFFESRHADGHKLRAWIGRHYVIWVISDDHGTAVGTYLLKLSRLGS